MDINKEAIEVLEALSNNERLVSQLYAAYAVIFPEYKDFWSGLVSDEKNHASWIVDFKFMVETGSVFFDQKRFNLKAIETFSAYIKEVITQAEQRSLSLRAALGLSWDIENALIEKEFFRIFASDSAEFKKLLQQLSAATTEHRNKIKNALDVSRDKS